MVPYSVLDILPRIRDRFSLGVRDSTLVSDVTIVTATYYRSSVETRFLLAQCFCEEAQLRKIPLLIVDGSPEPFVRSTFECIGATVVREKDRGMGPSRRQGFREAFSNPETKFVCWVEPEKYDLVRYVHEMADYMEQEEANILVPRRRHFVNYPTMQVHAETLANRMAEIYTGRWFDRWFGPKLFDRIGGEYFLNHNGEKYGDRWESIILPVDAALAGGLNVSGYEVDYTHPYDQLVDEEGRADYDLKRLEQMEVILSNIKRQAGDLNLKSLVA